MTIQRYNRSEEYQFLDVYEHLVLIMIIRREIINFALEKGHRELLQDPDMFYHMNYERTNADGSEDEEPPDTDGTEREEVKSEAGKKNRSKEN